jgi:hypothetical protein
MYLSLDGDLSYNVWVKTPIMYNCIDSDAFMLERRLTEK